MSSMFKLSLLLALSTMTFVAGGFTARKHKWNLDITEEEFQGKTAWVRDLETEQLGSFSYAMVRFPSHHAVVPCPERTLHDTQLVRRQSKWNPHSGCLRQPRRVQGQSNRIKRRTREIAGRVAVPARKMKFSVLICAWGYQDLVLSGIPYPSAVVCNNAGAAFVASWVSPSAVAAVSWGVGDAIALKSEITQLPPACGGVLTMKYSTTLKLLVAACGKSPASIVAIQVDDSDSLERGCTLTPGETVLVDGEAGREARGLALYNYDDRHFAVVGLTDGTIVKFSLPELAVVEKRHIDARNLAHFSVGNADHTLTLL
eukprot:416721-Rhodomonas_salina.1